MKPTFQLAALTCAALAASAVQAASYTYVGSWQVYDAKAPVWSSTDGVGNLAYTGQEAAALLFGGSAADYAISTVGDGAADIDFMAWYDVIGVGGNKFSQDYDHKYLGQYYGPVNGYNCCGDDNSPRRSRGRLRLRDRTKSHNQRHPWRSARRQQNCHE